MLRQLCNKKFVVTYGCILSFLLFRNKLKKLIIITYFYFLLQRI